MKAYSQDLRQRVLRAIDAGASQSQVAETFAISVPTIKRYRHQPDERPATSCQKQSQAALKGMEQHCGQVCESK